MKSAKLMKTKLLISVDELAGRLDQVSLIDTRPVHQFSAGHLPNALSLDLFYLSLNDTRIESFTSFMWTIAALFSKRGVDFSKEIVIKRYMTVTKNSIFSK